MTPFELLLPASFEEAIALLDPEDPMVRPIAGGTAVMLMMKAGVFRPTRLISLARTAPAMARIAAAPDGGLTIGAMTPLRALERAPEVAAAAPVITRTMLRLSNVRVRNVATIGGALAHADPHMDLPPVLIALGAEVTVMGPQGRRRTAVEDLLAGYYETTLARDELIADVHVPPQGARRAAYLKVTTGAAEDWPAVGIAVAFALRDGAIDVPRVVVSAATAKAMRVPAVEALLAGGAPDDALLARAGDAAAEAIETLGDVRGSAAYKTELIRVSIGRAVNAALASNGGTR